MIKMLVEKLNNLIQDEKDAIAKYQMILMDMKDINELVESRVKFTNFIKDETKHLKRLESVLVLVLKLHLDFDRRM
jgi:rubrerythrin